MKSLLQPKKSRRIFLLLIVSLLAIIILLRIFVIVNFHPEIIKGVSTEEPMWHALVLKLLDGIFVSLIVTVSVGLFMFYIEVPDNDKKFDIIESLRLEELFDAELAQTDTWHFSGGMGRHTRAKTIPLMDKSARSSNRHKSLKIHLLDPSDEKICGAYSSYRGSLSSAKRGKVQWSLQFVRRELLSTVLVAAIYKTNNPNFDIILKFKSVFSTLRIDLSSRAALITKEDRAEPALMCRSESFLFKAYQEEAAQTFKLNLPIDIQLADKYQVKKITFQDVQKMLNELSLDMNLSEDDYKAICKIIRDNDNPYA
ncbi:hypothetical protein [Pedobacter sandarakinus]|uniref:hypothetical protein n=1 Tax=Pedobacter sandarakinus TaxID=353156 RepID=UPI00224506F2|nr:hypothetical protein [Pedobacter sandarakinus]MCX2575703.1 hypothetical protein [Pedobacter sandarakinus]